LDALTCNWEGSIDKPAWYELCEDPILRQYFSDMCKAFTHIPEFQEDLYQEAMLRLGACKAGLDTPYYMHEGFKAMNAAYMREWRQWRLIRHGKDLSPRQHAKNQRIYRAREQFKKHKKRLDK
jgi:hypothetical protein